MKHKIEILAPAGNYEKLKQAVYAGADSVYFGGESFNARRNADNFSDEEIHTAVDFCHIHGVKAYCTLNTIMFQREIDAVVRYIRNLAEARVDAVIVQDMGILRLVREMYPEMPVHASTQMSAHSVSDCIALEELGVKRVVLARELSKDEMIRIKEQTTIELEVFVHGALCMSVSGQCYFSSALGERSGNRGLCAQVCRLPFYVEDKNRHNLSLKDLSLIDEIRALETIGITSAKIEGRMKDAEYVQATVNSIRDVLGGKDYDKGYLQTVFSRDGFTKGYYQSKLGNDMFGVKGSYQPREQSVSNCKQSWDRIPINVFYQAKMKERFMLSIHDNEGHSVQVHGAEMQQAHTKMLIKAEIESQLGKLGDTAYVIKQIGGMLDDGLFMAKSELNRIRREGCDQLDRLRSERNHYQEKPLHMNFGSSMKKEDKPVMAKMIRLGSAAQFDEQMLRNNTTVFLPLNEVNKLDLGLLSAYHKQLGIELPRIYFGDESLIMHTLDSYLKEGIHKTMCHTLGRVMLASEYEMDITGGFGLNITNEIALAQYRDLHVNHAVLSPEIQMQDVKSMTHIIPIGLIAYGKLPLMITRNCPVRVETDCRQRDKCLLTDRKGVRFPVVCQNGVTEILNAEPIYYGDKPEKLAGVDFHLFSFSNETKEECMGILEDYHLKRPRERITRGAYFRKIS